MVTAATIMIPMKTSWVAFGIPACVHPLFKTDMIRHPIKCAQHGSFPAAQAAATDHHGSDHPQLQSIGRGRIAGPIEEKELKPAGQARRQTAQGVDHDLDDRHVDAAESRGRLVRSDCIDVTTQQAVSQSQRQSET